MSTMLAPPAAGLRLWERFQAGKIPESQISRSQTLRRWKRCRDAGLSAESPGEPVMRLDGLAAAIERFGPMLAPGSPFDAFSGEMAKAGFCGFFCDERGVILSQRIAEPFRTESAIARLQAGAEWSEDARGTNGMGTALHERAPLSIVGTEHFERRNHTLACFAAPIRDVRRRIVAVLDASGPVHAASPYVQASVVATAAAIESLIIARTYDAAVPGGLFELERVLERFPHAALLVESTGHLRRANRRFLGMLPRGAGEGAAREDLARFVRSELGPEGLTGGATPPVSLESFAIEFEPIGCETNPFAAVLHLRPRASSGGPGTPDPALAASKGDDSGGGAPAPRARWVAPRGGGAGAEAWEREDLQTAERSVVKRALERSQGNLSAAARCLGVARSTLYRMMERHRLHPDRDPGRN